MGVSPSLQLPPKIGGRGAERTVFKMGIPQGASPFGGGLGVPPNNFFCPLLLQEKGVRGMRYPPLQETRGSRNVQVEYLVGLYLGQRAWMENENPVSLATSRGKLACFNPGREVIPPALAFKGYDAGYGTLNMLTIPQLIHKVNTPKVLFHGILS